jgi:hypothetical protein
VEIIKLTWVDVRMVTEPGRYDSRYGLIEVTPDDLWIWQKYPNAAFVLMQPSLLSDETVCRLGTFELREGWNVPGHEKGIEPECSEASISNERIDNLKDHQTEAAAPPKPEASDPAPINQDEPAWAPEADVGEEQLSDLQSRIDALIKGSHST